MTYKLEMKLKLRPVPHRREYGMTCLHLHPKDLRIPDWELQQDIVVIICHDCGKVFEIRLLSSQSPENLYKSVETLAERPAEIAF